MQKIITRVAHAERMEFESLEENLRPNKKKLSTALSVTVVLLFVIMLLCLR